MNLPCSISTVPRTQKELNRQLCLEGSCQLMHFSSQPLLPSLAPLVLVGEILGSKRQPLPEACSPASGLHRAPPCPCAHRWDFSHNVINWQGLSGKCCAPGLRPLWRSSLSPAFLTSTSYTKSHHSLERRGHQARSASCSMILRVSPWKEKDLHKWLLWMASIPTLKITSHTRLLEYEQAMTFCFVLQVKTQKGMSYFQVRSREY